MFEIYAVLYPHYRGVFLPCQDRFGTKCHFFDPFVLIFALDFFPFLEYNTDETEDDYDGKQESIKIQRFEKSGAGTRFLLHETV